MTIKNTISLLQKIKTSYNKRNVRYEKIHNLTFMSIYDYINVVKILNNYSILDHGSGYGAVSKGICNLFPELNLKLVLQDVSEFQIERALDELSNVENNKSIETFINTLKCCEFEDNQFDTAFSKIVFQEMSYNDQIEELIELKRIVKANGYIVLWDWWLEPECADFIRDVIRKKDKIAKLTTLVQNRYFPDSIQFNKIISDAGINIEKDVSFLMFNPLKYESKKQLEGDFKNVKNNLYIFNNYIRERAKLESQEVLGKLSYKEVEDNISINVQQMIIKINNNK